MTLPGNATLLLLGSRTWIRVPLLLKLFEKSPARSSAEGVYMLSEPPDTNWPVYSWDQKKKSLFLSVFQCLGIYTGPPMLYVSTLYRYGTRGAPASSISRPRGFASCPASICSGAHSHGLGVRLSIRAEVRVGSYNNQRDRTRASGHEAAPVDRHLSGLFRPDYQWPPGPDRTRVLSVRQADCRDSAQRNQAAAVQRGRENRDAGRSGGLLSERGRRLL